MGIHSQYLHKDFCEKLERKYLHFTPCQMGGGKQEKKGGTRETRFWKFWISSDAKLSKLIKFFPWTNCKHPPTKVLSYFSNVVKASVMKSSIFVISFLRVLKKTICIQPIIFVHYWHFRLIFVPLLFRRFFPLQFSQHAHQFWIIFVHIWALWVFWCIVCVLLLKFTRVVEDRQYA